MKRATAEAAECRAFALREPDGRRRRARRAKAVLLLVGLPCLAAACGDDSPRHDVPDDVRECTARLRTIYQGLVEFEQRFDRPPPGSGVSFFGELIGGGVWPPERANELTCPGPHATPQREGVDFTLAQDLTGADSAYAGRDTEGHPLPCFPCGGNHAILACDNAAGMNHDGVMNVLFTDGSVQTLRIDKLVEQGRLPAGTTTIPVGPSSPIETLRTLKP